MVGLAFGLDVVTTAKAPAAPFSPTRWMVGRATEADYRMRRRG